MSSSENFAARLAFRGSTADQPPLSAQIATLRHLKRFFAQVWRTSAPLTVASIVLRLLSAVQPLLLLYVAKLIIDEVVLQTRQPSPGPDLQDWIASGRLTTVAELLALEFALVVAADLLARGISLVDGILTELHSNTVSIELMEHAAGLDLKHFESSRIPGPAGARAPPGGRPQRAARPDLRAGPGDRHRRRRWPPASSSMRPG